MLYHISKNNSRKIIELLQAIQQNYNIKNKGQLKCWYDADITIIDLKKLLLKIKIWHINVVTPFYDLK